MRNRSAFRLAQKPSKRDVEWSEENLLALDAGHRLNTEGDFFYPDRYLRLDTTKMSAIDAARRIQERFDLTQESGARRTEVRGPNAG